MTKEWVLLCSGAAKKKVVPSGLIVLDRASSVDDAAGGAEAEKDGITNATDCPLGAAPGLPELTFVPASIVGTFLRLSEPSAGGGDRERFMPAGKYVRVRISSAACGFPRRAEGGVV